MLLIQVERETEIVLSCERHKTCTKFSTSSIDHGELEGVVTYESRRFMACWGFMGAEAFKYCVRQREWP